MKMAGLTGNKRWRILNGSWDGADKKRKACEDIGASRRKRTSI